MKAMILAGGSGTRLYPITRIISKQLLPIYDKPMIYYPLTTLIRSGFDDIAIITTPHDKALYEQLLGDGSQWGINITYIIQQQPRGIAEAYLLAEDFLAGGPSCLILGDNILYGSQIGTELDAASSLKNGAIVFSYYVKDPERYGVIKFNDAGSVIDILEKPKQFVSNYAVVGLYVYDQRAVEFAKTLKPSARNELEITDLNRCYLEAGELSIVKLGRGNAWLDTGTHDSLLDAGYFVEVLEKRQSLKIGCPEEAAWFKGFINDDQLIQLAKPMMSSGYGQYLMRLLERS